MRVKFDHVLPSTFGIIKRDLTLHGTRVPLPFSARLSKVQMKMDMYLTIILFPCFDLVVYAPPVSWLIASVRHAGSRTFCLWSPWTLTLVRSNLGTWAWTPSWRGKKRSLAQSQLLAYLLNRVCEFWGRHSSLTVIFCRVFRISEKFWDQL